MAPLFAIGPEGLDSCPEDYTHIMEAEMCASAAEWLGFTYNATAADGHSLAMCVMCISCDPKDVRLTNCNIFLIILYISERIVSLLDFFL